MVKQIQLYRRLMHAPLAWRIIAFLVTLVILWTPFALTFYSIGGLTGQSDVMNALALIALYGCFLGHAWFWGRWGHAWPKPFQTYGLVCCQRFFCDLAFAVAFGFALVCLLFGIEVLCGWANFHPQPLTRIAVEGLAVGLAFGFAEELLFRGWLQTELQQNLPRSQAIVWSSLIFAIAHFIKPLPDILRTSPQFLGLLLLGLILGCGRYLYFRKRSFASLGLPMGFHGGLIWGYYIVDVGDLVLPSGQVPEWVTGIHGNPLSGILGMSILVCLTAYVCFKLRSK
ncbi:CPBP family intramembrane metalloprotease [Leptolyngbyaceae cyanobacterium CCMR0082]|uniref:CPBP family intramembrane metalloprotease n=2 Tax=Adonisia turfae TaxID=2950184 RepID=A0A6M0S0B7_9CYAN|nr:type II CAAX endopeptidase family protein [Adonisia turfae]MDV3350892.1 type II CAAX endopeptidase family protein [Leptothoe sp. LEGE 181152]NEZ60164.1 CPBP family intramembrane metalloprotease [Adonisia turfae CCMR0081]NEZ61909.1 CPBP family intramembrane metalloprotease [Adonisia turfae CCMR0082]